MMFVKPRDFRNFKMECAVDFGWCRAELAKLKTRMEDKDKTDHMSAKNALSTASILTMLSERLDALTERVNELYVAVNEVDDSLTRYVYKLAKKSDGQKKKAKKEVKHG
jgi:hypothetical protein